MHSELFSYVRQKNKGKLKKEILEELTQDLYNFIYNRVRNLQFWAFCQGFTGTVMPDLAA